MCATADGRRYYEAMLSRWALFATLATLMCGCSGKGGAPGRVSGRVLIDSKPLPGGTVVFRSTAPKSFPVTVKLDENGNYAEVELPAGEVTVTVDNRALMPPAPRGAGIEIPKGLAPEVRAKVEARNRSTPPPRPKNQAGTYVPIPARYQLAETAEDLKFTVQSGDQKHDIELKSQ
jgi:hypothetical protein